jgi:tetratricopeptide (TPR) repeat protein
MRPLTPRLPSIGGFASGQPLLERALAISENALGPEHPLTAKILNNLGVLFENRRDYVSSETFHKRALDIQETVLGLEHIDTALTLNNLGFLFHKRGDLVSAGVFYERAFEIYCKLFGARHRTSRTIQITLYIIYIQKMKWHIIAAVLTGIVSGVTIPRIATLSSSLAAAVFGTLIVYPVLAIVTRRLWLRFRAWLQAL